MAKGVKATTRQKAAGARNIHKASVNRVGRRGTHYITKRTRGY